MMQHQPFMLGVRVFLNEILTVPGDPARVRRTWRERLLSRPWRPLRAFKMIPTVKPDPSVYRTAQGLFMHPDTWRRIQRQMLAAEKKEQPCVSTSTVKS